MNVIPLCIIAGLQLIGLGVALSNHGIPKKENAWASLISIILTWALLYWCLFF